MESYKGQGTPKVTALLDSLACPVCFEPTPPPIMQCENGHNICLQCQRRTDCCPICRGGHSPIRNLFAEAAFELLVDRVPCKFNDQGCTRSFSGNYKLHQHEQHVCPFRDFICNIRCATSKCDGKLVPFSQFLVHMSGHHALKSVKTTNKGKFPMEVVRGMTPQSIMQQKMWNPWTLICFGKVFVAMSWFKNSHIYLGVMGNISEQETNEFSARISVQGNSTQDNSTQLIKELIWKGPVHSMHAVFGEEDFENNPAGYMKIPLAKYLDIGDHDESKKKKKSDLVAVDHRFKICKSCESTANPAPSPSPHSPVI